MASGRVIRTIRRKETQSADVGRRPSPRTAANSPEIKAAGANKKLKVFYIACGKADALFTPSEEGHVWRPVA
jgi:hypothetical protein